MELTENEILLLYEVVRKELKDIEQYGHLIGNNPYSATPSNTNKIKKDLETILDKIGGLL